MRQRVNLETLWHKAKGRCSYCRCATLLDAHPSDDRAATRDHVIPLSSGHYKRNKPKNQVLACRRCNSLKGSLAADEFREFLKRDFAERAERARLMRGACA